MTWLLYQINAAASYAAVLRAEANAVPERSRKGFASPIGARTNLEWVLWQAMESGQSYTTEAVHEAVGGAERLPRRSVERTIRRMVVHGLANRVNAGSHGTRALYRRIEK